MEDLSLDQARRPRIGYAPDEEGEDARVSSREALRFLTRAGRALSTSLDPDQTLRRVVRLAVPRVACFAIIDLAREDGLVERVAYGHIDSAKESLLARPEPFRPRDEGMVPIQQVLDGSEAVLIERVERDWTGSAEVLERLRRLDGRSLIIVPLIARGQTFGALTFGSTRTDRYYRQADVSVARELARSAGLAIENARLYRRAEQAIASRDEVLAVVSHDLRNPVSRVRLAAETVLEMEPVAEGGRKMLGIVIRAADEMTRLIGDLLDVARVEAGTLSIEIAPVELSQLLERLDESHAAVASERRLVWRVVRPDTPLTLRADEGRLLQALGNLVGNAMKFTPESGEVYVEAGFTEGAVRICVKDTGPGMDETELAHVFDRFWQARAGDRRGAGLGLAIARGIVAAHGGRLWLESDRGRGTTAWIELPTSGIR
ncbi:MAG TPA: HAMP domain-containing sensor histidine kinase [Longimicrobiales bacterium]|nr:HAMP domain-containing sensor histidine kinase [Longimicrobiales bacterium]